MTPQSRTVRIVIDGDVTITIDEPIPYVPAEQASEEERCGMCKCRPSEGVGRCEDRDCKRAKVRTLDAARERTPRPNRTSDISWRRAVLKANLTGKKACVECGHDGQQVDQGGYCNQLVTDDEGCGDTCGCRCPGFLTRDGA